MFSIVNYNSQMYYSYDSQITQIMEERNSENQFYERLCGKLRTAKLGYDEVDYMRTVEKDLANYQTYIEDDIEDDIEEYARKNVEQNIIRSANQHVDYDLSDISQKDISIKLDKTHLSVDPMSYRLNVDSCYIDIVSVIYLKIEKVDGIFYNFYDLDFYEFFNLKFCLTLGCILINQTISTILFRSIITNNLIEINDNYMKMPIFIFEEAGNGYPLFESYNNESYNNHGYTTISIKNLKHKSDLIDSSKYKLSIDISGYQLEDSLKLNLRMLFRTLKFQFLDNKTYNYSLTDKYIKLMPIYGLYKIILFSIVPLYNWDADEHCNMPTIKKINLQLDSNDSIEFTDELIFVNINEIGHNICILPLNSRISTIDDLKKIYDKKFKLSENNVNDETGIYFSSSALKLNIEFESVHDDNEIIDKYIIMVTFVNDITLMTHSGYTTKK